MTGGQWLSSSRRRRRKRQRRGGGVRSVLILVRFVRFKKIWSRRWVWSRMSKLTSQLHIRHRRGVVYVLLRLLYFHAHIYQRKIESISHPGWNLFNCYLIHLILECRSILLKCTDLSRSNLKTDWKEQKTIHRHSRQIKKCPPFDPSNYSVICPSINMMDSLVQAWSKFESTRRYETEWWYWS